MKISVYPKFRKVWGMIDKDLDKGSYTFLINDCIFYYSFLLIFTFKKAYPVGEFAGEKYLVLSTKGILGFKNLLLVVGYYVAAFICILFFVLFYYLHRKQNKKKSE